MDEHVFPEFAAHGEAFITFGALERLYICMATGILQKTKLEKI